MNIEQRISNKEVKYFYTCLCRQAGSVFLVRYFKKLDLQNDIPLNVLFLQWPQ